MQNFIEKLSNKKIFIFGTVGFSDTKEYFDEILNNVKSHVSSCNTIIRTYMYQGKVSETMQNRIKEVYPEKYELMKDSLEKLVNHPNQDDIEALVTEVEKVVL